MRAVLLILALAVPLAAAEAGKTPTVKDDGAVLRAGCAESAEQVAPLKPGQPVKIRFALAGSGGGAPSGPCYAVSVEIEGRRLQGYLPESALAGLEAFEQARRAAAPVASGALPAIDRSEVQAVRDRAAETQRTGKVDFALAAQLNLAADALQSGRPADVEKILAKAGAPQDNRDAALLRAYALMELNQPDRALDILERAMRENKKDPLLLAAAGKAAYNVDDPRRALAYWREALDLRPDPSLEQVYKRVEKESAGDKSTQKSYGARFLLRYDNAVAGPELARAMVDALEAEFSRISFQLGCPADERIVTIVQSPDAYHQTTSAAEWSGGHYDGKIHIPLAPAKQIDPKTRQVFAHEIVHACMANIGRWPSWLHEGMAQKLAGESIPPNGREVLKVLARAGKLPKLEDLGRGWARLNIAQASIAYGVSLVAVELFFQQYNAIGPRNLMNQPELLERLTPELDRKLDESLKN